jgi:hypothetical protein
MPGQFVIFSTTSSLIMTDVYGRHGVNDLRFDLFKIDSNQSGLDAIGSDLAASNPAADSLPRHAVMIGSSSNGNHFGHVETLFLGVKTPWSSSPEIPSP